MEAARKGYAVRFVNFWKIYIFCFQVTNFRSQSQPGFPLRQPAFGDIMMTGLKAFHLKYANSIALLPQTMLANHYNGVL